MGSFMFAMVRRSALACALVAFAGASLHAQDPGPTLAQLAHRAWTIRDGAPGGVAALAQSADGFLWIGTRTGLYRFDGVRFEEFEPPSGQALLSRSVSALLPLPDGSFWVGYSFGGVSLLAGGHVVSYGARDGLPAGTVAAFARDSDGGVWAATTTGLARFSGGAWRRVGVERGFPGGLTSDLLVDRRGVLWASEITGVFVLPRGARRFVWRARSLDVAPGGFGMPREAPDGSVWGASATLGIVPLSDSSGGPPRAETYRTRGVEGFLIDRRANAWITGISGRLMRIPLPAGLGATATTGSAEWQTLPMSRVTGMSGSAVYV
ncbi:MAG TPA: two-component regulator propeller domain-containing protein, partial [Gemmatirosa sp.]